MQTKNNEKRVAVVIPAGGKGSRFNSDIPKQFYEIDGETILEKTASKFVGIDNIKEIVFALPENCEKYISELKRKLKLITNCDKKSKAFSFVSGGKTRTQSVKNSLEKISSEIDLVLIHDAARPFITKSLIEKIIGEFSNEEIKAVCPILPIYETIRKVENDFYFMNDKSIEQKLDRDKIFIVQTPQAFRKKELLEAYSKINIENSFTDDCEVLMQNGIKIKTIIGEKKI